MVRVFQDGQAQGSLAFAKADHKAARKQVPVCEGRKKLAVVPLRDPGSNKMRSFIPRTRLFGATAAALIYDAVSRVTTTLVAGWLQLVHMGYSDGFWDHFEGVLRSDDFTGCRGLKRYPWIRFEGRKV